MAKTRMGRGHDTLVQELGDGRKLSITQTAAGPRANLHEGGNTRSVDPAAFGVRDVSHSNVGSGQNRITVITPDHQAIDFTQRGDGSIDERIHTGGASRKK